MPVLITLIICITIYHLWDRTLEHVETVNDQKIKTYYDGDL